VPDQSTPPAAEILTAIPSVLVESASAGPALVTPEQPAAIDEAALRGAWRDLKHAEENYRAGKKGLEEKLARMERDSGQLRADREALVTDRKAIDEDRRRLDERRLPCWPRRKLWARGARTPKRGTSPRAGNHCRNWMKL
jgi:hypothetical protein